MGGIELALRDVGAIAQARRAPAPRSHPQVKEKWLTLLPDNSPATRASLTSRASSS